MNNPHILFLGILISPVDLEKMTFGWKSLVDYTTKTDAELIDIIEENAHSPNDIFITNNNNKFNPVFEKNNIVELFSASSKESIKVKTYYANDVNAIAYTLLFEPGTISQKLGVDSGGMMIDQNSTLQLFLNNSLTYYVIFTDPKLMISSMRPDPVPRLFLKVEKGKNNYLLFMKVIFGK